MHSNKRLIRQSFPICKWNAWYVHGVAREQASKEERLFDGNRNTSRPALVAASRRFRISPKSPARSPRSRCLRRCLRRPVATTTAASPPAIRAAVTSAVTASSTSSAIRTASPQLLPISSTTPTVRPVSLFLHYVDGEKRYIIHPKGMKVGDMVMSGAEADIKPGNSLALADIPVGTLIHAVELQPGKGAALARSAGTSIQLMGKEGNYALLRMPSSEMRRVLITCRATIGEVGNAEHSNIKIGKAGRNRWKGIRPTVRGTVMNPVDHPHGGGEGKNKSSGRHPVSPWGKPTRAIAPATRRRLRAA